MTSNWLDEVQFDDPAQERARRVNQCALLLANAHRWSKGPQGSLSNPEVWQANAKEYLRRFNHQRAYWGLSWDEVSSACQEDDVRWAMERQLTQ